MFEFIRTHRRWMQFILLLLIVPSFLLVGVQSYDSFVNREPELADVGKQEVSRAEFDAAHRNQLEQMRQRMGSRFDPALVDTPAMRRELLDQLIDQRLLAQVAADNRFSVSDGTLRNTIAAIPQVQDNGRFSPERYRQVLAGQGLTPTTFEAGLRRDLAVSRVLQPVTSSARLPASVIDGIESAFVQQRVVQMRTFAAADFRGKVQVSDQDVQAWYDANKQQLEVPEQVQAQYLVLDESAATQGVKVSDADIESYYKQNQSRYGQPERRRISHILIQVAPGTSEADRKKAREQADAIAKQAAANPAGFADLARKDSQDAGSAAQGGDLGWVVPPSLQQAVASLSKDQVSGVVETPAGFHILKVTDFQAGTVRPLAEVKDQVTAEIRKQMAAARFSDMATSLTKLVYDQRDSLQPAADALGVKLRTASGITRNGLLPATQAGAGAASAGPDAQMLDNPRVRQALFGSEVLRDKANSGVIELAPDTMIAVRVQEIKPAHVPALADVKASIHDRLVAERATKAAREAGEAALKGLQDGPAQATAPEGFGQPVTVSRQDPGQTPTPLLETIMGMAPATEAKPGYAGVAMGNDYTVVRLNSVGAGTAFTADQRTMLGSQLGEAWGAAEQEAVIKVLRQQYDVKVLPGAETLMNAPVNEAG
ncbi:peptidyl-prolyl cis-trans isomerase D [Bordetella ansorpii]|uniref:Periplasmic chaperone PpiD n=1 Tax=Bordetella ansorpii TaxID=288768 RepID=A0A157R963_9BORD|nr:SurA N-terminal domain-containing protein [Bordetella ansorpii]SAI54364.1 peptidyl-prolyl cis-trans isomerase D [Bordetella ansorpii]